MKTDLKPCPFCGGKAQFVRTGEGQFGDEDDGFVECRRCHVRQPDKTRSRAAAAWNRRTEMKGDAK